ncbi:MAG: AraC family transcriptional regulator [Verrucomicrobiota bacterium]
MKSVPPIRRCVLGKDLALPILTSVRSLRSHDSTRLSWHSHDDYELIFVLEGATNYEFARGQDRPVTSNTFLFIPPGVVHRGAYDARSPVTLCGIEFDPRRPDAHTNTTLRPAELPILQREVSRSGVTLRACSPAMQLSIRQLFTEIDFRTGRTSTPLGQVVIRTLLCKIIVEASRMLRASQERSEKDYIAAAKDHLMRQLQQPFSLADLLKRLGISRTRLFNLFKAETGLTPNDFLVRCRIQEAQRLLANTKHSVTDIAFDVGFNSSQYFCRAFLRYTGFTPTSFRQSLKAGRPPRSIITPPQPRPLALSRT